MPESAREHVQPHRHLAVTFRSLEQLQGVPYEVERTVCRECQRLLNERLLRRAAA